jgi:pilus assembly protein Flp/PilA
MTAESGRGSRLAMERSTMWNFWRRLIDDERGQGLVEYSLIILLVVIACVGALTTFGGALAGNISNSASTLFG